jgi:putative oxidoreductase
MTPTTTTWDTWTPRVLSILRIMAALLFMAHGIQKFLGFPAPFPLPLTPLLDAQGVIEIVGGCILLVGLFTRPVAFILSGNMAVAYFMSHATRSLFPVANGGDAAVLYCFIFFFLVFAGGGSWSIDAMRTKPA